MWCVAELTPEYVAKMEDVLALYERPYNAREPVVCLDEKPVSLHADVRPARVARPGHIAKRDNEYARCGTANLFGIVEPKAGRHFTTATPDRSAQQFAVMVRRIVTAYPRARRLHLVLDNLNIHCQKSLTDAFGPREGRRVWRRLCVHFTPTHGSWLNQAELELSLVSRGCLGRRRIASLAALREETRAWTHRANQARTRIDWRFTRTDARRKFGYPSKLSTRSQT
jgi:hypothetical protein